MLFVFPKQKKGQYSTFGVSFQSNKIGAVQHFGDQGAPKAVLFLFVVSPKQKNRDSVRVLETAVLSVLFASESQK